MKIYLSFFSINIVNPCTTFINLPSFIKFVKKSTLEFLIKFLAFNCETGDKYDPKKFEMSLKILIVL